MLNASSTSGIPALKSVMPLKRSCKGGVNFNDATAIVAKNGTISNKFVGLFLERSGKRPIEKIRVTPNGSINALGS